MIIAEKLRDCGIQIPIPPLPVANFLAYQRTGSLISLSGQGPIIDGKPVYQGKLGREVSTEDGYQAARLCALNLLAQLNTVVEDLKQISKIVSVRGFVASTDEFYDQPAVINGCSDLLVELFGENGRHSRCAIGVNVLPGNIPVEIEMLVEVTNLAFCIDLHKNENITP